jgi:hypothetical protein
MSANAEGFLDQLITWRELGYNFTSHRRDYDRYASLPGWARKTLDKHTRDERKHVSSLSSSKPLPRTTRYGMRRRRNLSMKGGPTTICGCCGERRSWSGRALPKKRWKS